MIWNVIKKKKWKKKKKKKNRRTSLFIWRWVSCDILCCTHSYLENVFKWFLMFLFCRPVWLHLQNKCINQKCTNQMCVRVQLKGYDILSVWPRISTFLMLIANIYIATANCLNLVRGCLTWSEYRERCVCSLCCLLIQRVEHTHTQTQSAHSVCHTHNLRAFVRDMRNGFSFFLHF